MTDAETTAPSRFLTIEQVMDLTTLSRRSVEKLLDTRELPARKVGRRRLIRLDDYERWASTPEEPQQ